MTGSDTRRGSEEETKTASSPAADRRSATLDLDSPQTLRSGEVVGRFSVLSEIGSGGMGQVYAVYDPMLDRRVALKVLHDDGSSDDRARLLREAKALARLSHPNVVTVHEVLEHQGRILVAMEFVDGVTLKQWLIDHGPGASKKRLLDALGLLIQAGRGLEAAHAAGLVHRDFKPSNVLVGHDGRVRVADFGLARSWSSGSVFEGLTTEGPGYGTREDSQVTQTGLAAGTPAYMAPEQFSCAEVDDRADQYSYSMTAWELLFGKRPTIAEPTPNPDALELPRGLEQALRRGLSERPRARHPNMGALLRDISVEHDRLLGKDARRRGRRGWVAAGVVATTVMGLGAAQWLRDQRSEKKCEARGGAINEVWNEQVREVLRERIVATGAAHGAEFAESLMPWIDRYVQSWQESSVAACSAAEVQKNWTYGEYNKALSCLDDRLGRLSALIEEFKTADDARVQNAILAVVALPLAEACIDRAVLAGSSEPPALAEREQVQIARAALNRARYMEHPGELRAGIALAHQARRRAEALGWPAIAAEARAVEAKLLRERGDLAASEVQGERAYLDAVAAGAWDVAASAAIQQTFLVGATLVRVADGELWSRLARVAIEHAGDPRGLLEAGRKHNLGIVYRRGGRYVEAEELHRQSLQAYEAALGPEHPFIADALSSLGHDLAEQGQYVESTEYTNRALQIWERTHGTQHPRFAGGLNDLGFAQMYRAEYEEAEATFLRALAVSEEAFGPEDLHVAVVLSNLGGVQAALGHHEKAREAHRRALAITERELGPEHPDVALELMSLANRAKSLGELAKAEQLFKRALSILERGLGADHPDVANTLAYLADAQRMQGDLEASRLNLLRALAIHEAVSTSNHPNIAFALTVLGDTENEQQRFAEAIEHLERAVEIRLLQVPSFRLADSQFMLARALWDAPVEAGGDKKRARSMAEQAHRVYVDQEHPGAADVEAWLAEHPEPG